MMVNNKMFSISGIICLNSAPISKIRFNACRYGVVGIKYPIICAINGIENFGQEYPVKKKSGYVVNEIKIKA